MAEELELELSYHTDGEYSDDYGIEEVDYGENDEEGLAETVATSVGPDTEQNGDGDVDGNRRGENAEVRPLLCVEHQCQCNTDSRAFCLQAHTREVGRGERGRGTSSALDSRHRMT